MNEPTTAQELFERGEAFRLGNGVEQDYAKAAHWWRLAADQEYANAQFCLGHCQTKSA